MSRRARRPGLVWRAIVATLSVLFQVGPASILAWGPVLAGSVDPFYALIAGAIFLGSLSTPVAILAPFGSQRRIWLTLPACLMQAISLWAGVVFLQWPWQPLGIAILATTGLATIALLRKPLSRETDGFTCAGCGYDLTGLDGSRCPECGRPSRMPIEIEK